MPQFGVFDADALVEGGFYQRAEADAAMQPEARRPVPFGPDLRELRVAEYHLVRCPDSSLMPDGITEHTIIGCGQMIPDVRDFEGLVDCPECGIWFNPEEENVNPPTTQETAQ